MRDINSNSFIQSVSGSTTRESLISYIKAKEESEFALLFGIFTKNDFEHIGNVKLEPLILADSATIGILIGEESWRGRGVGFEVLSKLVNFAFTDLKLKRVDLGVHVQNFAAVNLYKKLGFTINSPNPSSEALKMELDSTSWFSKRDSP
jgi:[ribosomal protein S5]-alanine N-acetyltransferase